LASHPLGDQKKVFAMMQAYMDDSGSHSTSHNCVVGGYFGGVNEWRKFERQWKPILDEYRISEFHARRFYARNSKKEFVGEYKGWPNRRRLEFLDKLLKVIESRKIYPFASGVIGEEWVKENVEHRRLFTGATKKFPSGAPSKPLFVGFMTCVVRVASHCHPGVKVNFVFDDNPQTVGWASICYSGMKALVTKDRSLTASMGDLSFASSKTALPLQAADLIAYEAHNWAKESSGNENHLTRPVYRRALRNFKTKEDFWLYDAQRLTTLRKIFGFLDH
jgi:hypothetical protein